MSLHQYYSQRKWKVYSNNLCKKIWESSILALEAGGGIKQQDLNEQDCQASSCSLLAPLLCIFLPRAEDGAGTGNKDAECLGGALQGHCRLEPCSRTADHSSQGPAVPPAPLKALLGTAQHSLQQMSGGRAAAEMRPSVPGENKGLFGKSYQPCLATSFIPGWNLPFSISLSPPLRVWTRQLNGSSPVK